MTDSRDHSPDSDTPDGDLLRDAYAHFGVAYFLAEAVFQGLVQIVATAGEHLTRGAIEERMARASRLTLGPLVAEARSSLPPDRQQEIDRCIERRNFLAHGFWFDRAYMLSTATGVREVIRELEADQELFRSLSQMTDDINEARLRAAGIPDFDLDVEVASSAAVPHKPLPSRLLPKAGTSIRLVRAWAVPEGAVLFEDEAAEFWQLSELGLGWYTGPKDADWKPARLTRDLPATVVARPKGALPWNYALEFSSGARIEVSKSESDTLPTIRVVPALRPHRPPLGR